MAIIGTARDKYKKPTLIGTSAGFVKLLYIFQLLKCCFLFPPSSVMPFLRNNKEPITAISHKLSALRLVCKWLCDYASGSLITDIFSCFTLTKLSCLHFGQNNGKFSSTVSSRIFTRVLLLQTGQMIHSVLSMTHLSIAFC